jgi:hypothetical protein
MAHVCNLSYTGGTGWEDGSLKPAQAKKKKKLVRSYLKNKPGVVVHACNLSYQGGGSSRIAVQG